MSQLHLIENNLAKLPWYVEEFIEHRSIKSSENTLLEYTRDYLLFFSWLVEESFYKGETKDVPIDVLEKLRVKDITSFESYCRKKRENSLDTIARKVTSLKSLFHYLSQIAEDENYYPYLKRNVMAKVEIHREKHTETEKAERISSRILIDEEIEAFREFIISGYRSVIQGDTRSINYYEKNKIRDLALVSLILGSGLRVSEVVSLDIDKVDWHNQHVLVRRKGGKHDKVVFSDIALRDLYDYKEIREDHYHPDPKEKALFVTLPSGNGTASRMSKITAQTTVNKYAEAFGKGTLSIHKLRHTFATQHYKMNKDIAALKRQLGHSDMNTTSIYTHVFDNTLIDSVNKADN